MDKDTEERELTFDKPIFYGNGVLFGRWFEERRQYQPNNYRHRTEYSTSYTSRTPEKETGNVMWNLRLNDERNDIFPHNQYGGLYYNNFSTVYDLAHNHFPKCLGGPMRRKGPIGGRAQPMEEYAKNYGNLTRFGLTDRYESKWRCDLETATQVSEYRLEYEAPKRENYETKRFATPAPNSSSLCKVNELNRLVKFRGKRVLVVPPTEEMVRLNYERRLNPVTWT